MTLPRQWRHPKLVWGSSDSTLADLLVSWDLLKRAAQLAKDGQIFHSSSISSTRHWLYPLTSSENASSAPVCPQNVSFVSGTHRQLLGLYSALHTQQLRPWEDAYPHAGARDQHSVPIPGFNGTVAQIVWKDYGRPPWWKWGHERPNSCAKSTWQRQVAGEKQLLFPRHGAMAQSDLLSSPFHLITPGVHPRMSQWLVTPVWSMHKPYNTYNGAMVIPHQVMDAHPSILLC